MKAVPRREFLWRALAACGGGALVPAGPVWNAQAGQAERGAPTSAGYFGDQVTAVRAIGETYMRQLGRDATPEAIRAAATTALRTINRARDDASAIRALAQAVREDFERERLMQVEGWVLSRTEAELCALTLLAP